MSKEFPLFDSNGSCQANGKTIVDAMMIPGESACIIGFTDGSHAIYGRAYGNWISQVARDNPESLDRLQRIGAITCQEAATLRQKGLDKHREELESTISNYRLYLRQAEEKLAKLSNDRS